MTKLDPEQTKAMFENAEKLFNELAENKCFSREIRKIDIISYAVIYHMYQTAVDMGKRSGINGGCSRPN